VEVHPAGHTIEPLDSSAPSHVLRWFTLYIQSCWVMSSTQSMVALSAAQVVSQSL
jgi:hypothetical protein